LANLPPAGLLASGWRPFISAFVSRLIRALQPGQQITSFYRTPEQNRAEGGDPESQHLFALAVDLVGPGQRLTQTAARNMHLIAVQEYDHLHIQMFPRGVLRRAGIRFPRVRIQPVTVSDVDTTFR